MEGSRTCRCGKREANNPLCICYSFPEQSEQIMNALGGSQEEDVDAKIPLLLDGPNEDKVPNVRITRQGSLVSVISQEISFAQRSFANSFSSYGSNRCYDAEDRIDHCHTKKPDTSSTKAAQRKLTIASIVCLLFLIGEFIGMLFLKIAFIS